MGCCGSQMSLDYDLNIENAQSLEELAQIFREKKKKIPTEKIQIKAFMKDRKTKVEDIDVQNLNNEMLEERLKYLNEIENAYLTVIKLLSSNNKLDVNGVKPYLQKIANKYFFICDPNQELSAEISEFSSYVNKSLQKNKEEK